MVRKIQPAFLNVSDYPHRFNQIRGPWNKPIKEKSGHSQFRYPHNGTDVTLFDHLPPPSHAYDRELMDQPEPYFGREGCDVTEMMRHVSGSNKPTEFDYFHGREKTDVTEHLKHHIPFVVNPLGEVFWGRPKCYVTDPSVSPNLTPPGRPVDGVGTKGAMTWPTKSREDQIPLGKTVSKLQSILNALARSQRKDSPAKPPHKGASGKPPPKKRNSPGQPVGKSGKEFPPPDLQILVPEFDATYFGRTKSYITDYAVSPNLTPLGRPLDGDGAKHAMTFALVANQGIDRDTKIPLGKAVKRFTSPPRGSEPMVDASCAKQPPKCEPCAKSSKTASAQSPPKSPTSPPPSAPTSPKGNAPKCRFKPKSPPKVSSPRCRGTMKCKLHGVQPRMQQPANLRWRDQLQSGIGPLASPCCNKKKPRGPPLRPKIPAIKCPRPLSSVSKRKAQLSPSLSSKLISGEVGDPHHDVPWHGRAKCYITDPSVSPNLTPPGRQSFRTPQQKAESMAKRFAQGH